MSSKAVFSVLLICMLAGTPMASNSGPWVSCDPAWGFPVHTVPRCRAVVKLQCVGSQVPVAVLRGCCQQLADIDNYWCRCDALGKMLSNVYKELGAQEKPAATEVFPGCRKEEMHLAAASLPGVCNVPIPNPSGDRADVCYWATYPDV